ncbi:hypothetical protein JOB18_029084 [Solea senegalensis]|uniref:Uncharacterized protein n=1 Tax=Solea senegalensis TaxID=28829 RepID=A0AAV6S3V8_SOLSE|nr:hypothetical protein JOB18_029084 [Solea senegalensis]
MVMKGVFIWLCSVAAFSSGHVSDQQEAAECAWTAQHTAGLLQSLRNVTDHLLKQQLKDVSGKNATGQQEAAECALSPQQTAALLQSMRTVTDLLYKEQLKECPEAEVPDNGGLACVTVNNKRYCKPMCNYGYDFMFMRRSRLYEECSKETGYKWNTQYIGGNKLAVCNKEPTQVSGASSAYFPKDRDCLTTKTQHLDSFIDSITAEIQSQGILGKPENACLLCGRP